MAERRINWGADGTDAKYRTEDSGDPGNFVVAEDLDGNTILLEWNATSSSWEYGGPVDLDGNDLTDAGTTVYDASADTVGDGTTSADHASVATGEIVDFWAGSAYQVSYPYPKWHLNKFTGGGSVTFTDTQIQLREPGNASAEEESRAADDLNVVPIDPSVPGRVKIHISNITIDNDSRARIALIIGDAPGSDGQGDDSLVCRPRGDGSIKAVTSNDGSTSASTDTSQDNAYISGLNTIELGWDGSSLTVTTDDGSTEVTITESGNYPSGENLFVSIVAIDSNGGAAQNCDYDVDAIEVGT